VTPVAPLSNQTAYLTDVGRVRSENQDACSELRDPSGAQLLVVADGMGGHRGGATASRMAIETVREVFERSPNAGGEMLREALETANARVYRASSERAELYGMGTTCVALLFEANAAWVAHVGDSRAYRLRDGQLLAITHDHSAVAELLRRGVISAEEAAVHPRRNELLRSIGVEPSTEVDVSPVDVRAGDRFLLCSDGLSSVVPEEEIGAVLGNEPPEQAARTLVDSANAYGGPDNVTVMITAFPERGALAAVAAAEKRHRVDEIAQSQRKRRSTLVLLALLLAAALLLLVLSRSGP
jgi:serine/threonine protein phosphatase PrpC